MLPNHLNVLRSGALARYQVASVIQQADVPSILLDTRWNISNEQYSGVGHCMMRIAETTFKQSSTSCHWESVGNHSPWKASTACQRTSKMMCLHSMNKLSANCPQPWRRPSEYGASIQQFERSPRRRLILSSDMLRTIAEANRQFSTALKQAADGETAIITRRGTHSTARSIWLVYCHSR